MDDLEVPLTGEELDSITSHERARLIHDTQPVEVKKPELKPLSLSLRYAFLDESKYYPMIVSASLNDGQMSRLLFVLRKHKKAIGYSIDDLKGISRDFCI